MMLAEKLLLHILIIMAPMFFYGLFIEHHSLKKSKILGGILQGVAACLCMLFPFISHGFHWDLRYVPIIVAFLYGGPIAGTIAFLMVICMRIAIGGPIVLYGIGIIVLSVSLSCMFVKRFYEYSPNRRIMIGVLMGVWSAFSATLTVLLYMWNTKSWEYDLADDLLPIALIQMLGMIASVLMHELIVERIVMRQEMKRVEKMNTLGELAASIAHEVRNPLTVVKGFLQMMKQGENYQYVPLVLSEVERAEKIISDYLNFAKPQFQEKKRFCLDIVLNEVCILLEPLAMNKGISLQVKMGANPLLETDADQLKQALLNIIKNAIEATSSGGVVVTTAAVKSGVEIRIVDTGKGMTTEQLERIGTLFYTTKDKGTGLGTLISLRIINMMNGTLMYKSQPGVGTEATITLPTV
ncbi:ATP-binding protein [Ectobacillus antri]|uniref:histidine kinase n=1 Tax=Ectobacillus antri TaxID=2486280 RepID=A0ABT6H4I6_9BACI|nr:ATP-binding protein [Ectobacillus antri]MDG4656827.1 ATP-binding protein [Ectobacillus antri]MDG5754276.1 ATP-binding protein [Ectobacillus antri]